jgi:hypothetical protein
METSAFSEAWTAHPKGKSMPTDQQIKKRLDFEFFDAVRRQSRQIVDIYARIRITAAVFSAAFPAAVFP